MAEAPSFDPADVAALTRLANEMFKGVSGGATVPQNLTPPVSPVPTECAAGYAGLACERCVAAVSCASVVGWPPWHRRRRFRRRGFPSRQFLPRVRHPADSRHHCRARLRRRPCRRPIRADGGATAARAAAGAGFLRAAKAATAACLWRSRGYSVHLLSAPCRTGCAGRGRARRTVFLLPRCAARCRSRRSRWRTRSLPHQERFPHPAREDQRPAAGVARQCRHHAEAAGGHRPAGALLCAREFEHPPRGT